MQNGLGCVGPRTARGVAQVGRGSEGGRKRGRRGRRAETEGEAEEETPETHGGRWGDTGRATEKQRGTETGVYK